MIPHAGSNFEDFRKSIQNGAVQWKRHVLERMMERAIGRVDVLNVLLDGERIEDYPLDAPFPSALYFGWKGTKPLHVVAAYDHQKRTVHIITVYEPDEKHFGSDFRTRKYRT